MGEDGAFFRDCIEGQLPKRPYNPVVRSWRSRWQRAWPGDRRHSPYNGGVDLVACNGVGIRYGEVRALADFDLTLTSGKACALIGPNGAGTSTALKLLAGLEMESAGSLQVNGKRPGDAGPEWKRTIGLLPEHLALFDALTIAEHLELSGDLYGLARRETRERAEELLGLLGLGEGRERFAAACSYGMRKKTAFAMALLHRPKLLLLDEPFEGLDPASCENVLALLLRAKESGMGIVVSSHMLMHVERLSDEVLLLDGGRVGWRGTALSEGGLQEHYLRLIAAAPMPPLAWL